MTSKTNKHRADLAENAVRVHAAGQTGASDWKLDPNDVACLLANLRHYCHQRGIDFEEQAKDSLEFFDEELAGLHDWKDEAEEGQ